MNNPQYNTSTMNNHQYNMHIIHTNRSLPAKQDHSCAIVSVNKRQFRWFCLWHADADCAWIRDCKYIKYGVTGRRPSSDDSAEMATRWWVDNSDDSVAWLSVGDGDGWSADGWSVVRCGPRGRRRIVCLTMSASSESSEFIAWKRKLGYGRGDYTEIRLWKRRVYRKLNRR